MPSESAHGVQALVLVGVTLALLLGVVPGIWAAVRGYERSRGHAWIAAVVAVVALVGLYLYTVGGPSEELFTRLVILPFSLVIAVAVSAVLVGAPMYTGYFVAYRVARSMVAKDGQP